MGQLRNATTQDRKSFPGADFAAVDAVPVSQCEGATFFGFNAVTATTQNRITDTGAFPADGIGRQICHITASPTGNTGLFVIDTTTVNFLRFLTDPGNSIDVEYHLQDADPPVVVSVLGITFSVPFQLQELGRFAGMNLQGLICRISTSPLGNTGDFTIISSTTNVLTLAADPGISPNVEYTIISPHTFGLTSSVQEIHASAQAAGAATMIKGGQLFIDGVLADMESACKINLNPA